jgi:hypothetical protein
MPKRTLGIAQQVIFYKTVQMAEAQYLILIRGGEKKAQET